MSNTKHTPGPWKIRNERIVKLEYLDGRVVEEGIEVDIIQDLTNEHITTLRKVAKLKPTVLANAQLIAAAPIMLKEMEMYLPILESLEKNEPDMWDFLTQGTGIATLNGYRNAIAKATGKFI
jgi:hypothetical protein